MAVRKYCGTAVDGDIFFQGPTRLSLVDPTARRILINTIRDTWSAVGRRRGRYTPVPHFVGHEYYSLPHQNFQGKGVPEICIARFTGEGVASQFALFKYQACGIAAGTVLGYSPRSDRVVQYPIEVHDENGSSNERWVMQVFSTKPVGPGRWAFRWRAGHGSEDVYDEDVSFDVRRQAFVERQTTSRPTQNVK